jgi:hypothetical protein
MKLTELFEMNKKENNMICLAQLDEIHLGEQVVEHNDLVDSKIFFHNLDEQDEQNHNLHILIFEICLETDFEVEMEVFDDNKEKHKHIKSLSHLILKKPMKFLFLT